MKTLSQTPNAIRKRKKVQALRREAWARRLESGEFQQTKGFLRIVESKDPDGHTVGYCCLGVACVVYNEANSTPHQLRTSVVGCVRGEVSDAFTTMAFEDETADTPDTVNDWFGLDPNVMKHLAYKNDNDYTFAQIAAMIRTFDSETRVEHGQIIEKDS